jgi:D-aminopeptidase
LRINVKAVGKLGLNALIAGTYNPPITLVTGDQTMAEEAKDLHDEVECTVVIIDLDRYAARCSHPSIASQRIYKVAERTVHNIDTSHPFKI